ncbi:MAG: hypothetical protein IPM42_16845 [Saprospiraceae bacterium]|nr:hypothetical protein [Saprospiraceae bacterium]
MKLIFVHGRAQEDFEEAALKQAWIESFKKGLTKAGLTLPNDVTIDFPYYGKMLKQLVDEAQKPLESSDVTRSGYKPTESEEIQFFESFLGEIALNSDLPESEKKEILRLSEQERGILNWELVHKIAGFIDTKGYFSSTLLKKFTLDVFFYLNINEIKRKINQKVESVFDNEPCVVVGHSLGSIVSYLVLLENPNFHVKKFVTLGSPLGMNSIRKHLEPKRMPSCVKNGWYNAFDERDFIALKRLDKINFNIRPEIINSNHVKNFTDNRHGIVGYLEDDVVATQIFYELV